MTFNAEGYVNKATEIRDTFIRGVMSTRSDSSLSAEGKYTQIKDLYERSTAELEQNGRAATEDIRNRVLKLQRTLFGADVSTSHDAISFRDATDRAQAITTEAEATASMESANLSGDTVLQSALLKRAYDAQAINGNPWTNVIDAYRTARPDNADATQELLELTTPNPPFARALNIRPIRPPELGR